MVEVAWVEGPLQAGSLARAEPVPKDVVAAQVGQGWVW